MARLGMKAAASSDAQISDRETKLTKLGLKPYIELHLGSLDDITLTAKSNADLCRKHPLCEFSVHFPIMDARTGYIFDVRNDEKQKLVQTLDFCGAIASKVLILHRCYGFDSGLDKAVAEAEFFGKLKIYNELGRQYGIEILFENYGFAWLPEGMGKKYAVSPLDHFFPWEIRRFSEFREKEKLANVGIALDIAHAALSSNMFNLLKKNDKLRADDRFSNIVPADLKETKELNPIDFVAGGIKYYHVSDSFIWDGKKEPEDQRKYLYSEGLEIGKGDLNMKAILGKTSRDSIYILEVNPEDGNHSNNSSQERSAKWFLNNVK